MPHIRPGSSVPSLLDRISQGEGISTEFKRLIHSPAKIARSIAAFANTEGGVIIIGVDDDKRIVGIHSEKETVQVIDEALRYHIDPRPEIELSVEEYKRRMVLLIEIPESRSRPHFHIEESLKRDSERSQTDRRVFIREGSHNRAASDDRIALMQHTSRPVRLTFSDRERRLLGYLREHERITAEEFAEFAGIPLPGARDILVTLVRNGMIRMLQDGRNSAYALAAG